MIEPRSAPTSPYEEGGFAFQEQRRFSETAMMGDRYVLVLDDSPDIIRPEIILSSDSGKKLSERKCSLVPSQRFINVALCLIVSAVGVALIVATFPPAIVLALKLITIAVGILSCANNNFRSSEGTHHHQQPQAQPEMSPLRLPPGVTTA